MDTSGRAAAGFLKQKKRHVINSQQTNRRDFGD